MASESPRQRTIKKAIIFCGNGGVGKSFVCNTIFKLHKAPTRFTSSSSVLSVTGAIQLGQIKRQGVEYTLVDTPGFFDNKDSTKTTAQVDGENVCKLVAALESCHEIHAIVYVFTDRFLEPQKHWYDRLKDILTPAGAGQIVLLHNKVDSEDTDGLYENKAHINQIVGGSVGRGKGRVDYFWMGQNPKEGEVEKFLNHVTQLLPFQLSNLKVPEVCYDREEIGPRFKMVVPGSTTERDEGEKVTLKAKEDKVVEETTYGERAQVDILGLIKFPVGDPKKIVTQKLEPSESVTDEWKVKMVTRRKIGVFVKVWKVRFDGTRDFVEDREVDENLREDEVFGD